MSVNQLPDDILLLLFHEVSSRDAKSIFTLVQVCKRWRDVCARDEVWKSLCEKKFPEMTSITQAHEKDLGPFRWKDHCQAYSDRGMQWTSTKQKPMQCILRHPSLWGSAFTVDSAHGIIAAGCANNAIAVWRTDTEFSSSAPNPHIHMSSELLCDHTAPVTDIRFLTSTQSPPTSSSSSSSTTTTTQTAAFVSVSMDTSLRLWTQIPSTLAHTGNGGSEPNDFGGDGDGDGDGERGAQSGGMEVAGGGGMMFHCDAVLEFCHTACINAVDVCQVGVRGVITPLALTCSDDGSLRLHDLAVMDTVRVWTAHKAPVYCCRFGDESQPFLALSGSFDNSALLWDLRKQPPAPVAKLKHMFRVYSVDQQGHTVITASGDGSLRNFDLRMTRENQEGVSAVCVSASCDNWIETVCVDNSLILAGGVDGYVSVWDRSMRCVGHVSLPHCAPSTPTRPNEVWKIRKVHGYNWTCTRRSLGTQCAGTYAIAQGDGSISLVTCDIFADSLQHNTPDDSPASSSATTSSSATSSVNGGGLKHKHGGDVGGQHQHHDNHHQQQQQHVTCRLASPPKSNHRWHQGHLGSMHRLHASQPFL